jgi:hypothetical protein
MGILGFPNPDQRQFPRIKDNIFIFGNLKLHSTNLGTNPLANPIGGFRVFAKDISARGLRFEIQRNIFGENDELEVLHPPFVPTSIQKYLTSLKIQTR